MRSSTVSAAWVRRRKLLPSSQLGDNPAGIYNAKYTTLQNEKAAVLNELAAHERANEHYFDEMETFLLFAHRLSAVFAKGGPERKLAVLRIVASNGVLKGRQARLTCVQPSPSCRKRGRVQSAWGSSETFEPP